MPKYFIGNVLSPTETQPESHDRTFAFTREETDALNMEGVPIRMEHHPEMEVGVIKRGWTDKSGRKWVLGSLNDDGLQSRFAKYAIGKGPTGTAYYTGLSLQHTHTQYASGKTLKTPVEVSLCVNPRRDDCRIAFVDSELNHDETEKVTYKILQQASNKMASETPVEQPQEVQKVEETPAAPVAEAPKEESTEMTREEMMQVIIQQQKELEEQTSAKTKEQKELEELKAMMKKQKEEEAAQEAEKARALSQALVDQWASTLDKSTMTDANKESIMKMARDFPKESMEMLRVAHCASKAHQAQIQKFEDFKKMSENMALKQRFEAVMQKKRPREEPVKEIVHAASTRTQVKKQKKNTENVAMAIVRKYRASGSAVDHMSALSEMQTPNRRRSRQPYY
tara:strand:- start:2592 stop:3779 length:1188 start_codon:yes stop_codon:yes gene_type:complete